MYNYFLKKQESIKRFVTNLKLPKNVYAMKVGSVPVLDSYQQYRTGRCNKTPKTDIALIYDSGQIYQRVSLKKYTGKNNVGQGASCN